eukprot:TRINITY_DN36304_c0_g3_i1.p1 TRINITY_DN36304_c0_g3~~TRINITY_DN36304_c0_g3_i1.p1  ORF type:complete len:1141 (+),score=286.35 TRINITY_DN36304_c0_g3_i1:159-3581(+)
MATPSSHESSPAMRSTMDTSAGTPSPGGGRFTSVMSLGTKLQRGMASATKTKKKRKDLQLQRSRCKWVIGDPEDEEAHEAVLRWTVHVVQEEYTTLGLTWGSGKLSGLPVKALGPGLLREWNSACTVPDEQIRPGDEIVQVNQLKWSLDAEGRFIQTLRKEVHLTIHFQRGHEETAYQKAQKKQDNRLHATISSRQVAKLYGVPKDAVLDYCNNDIREIDACKSLPFSIVSILSYCYMVFMYDPVVFANAVEDPLEWDIRHRAEFYHVGPNERGHKVLDDVDTIADVWSWLINGYVPTILPQENPVSENAQYWRDQGDFVAVQLSNAQEMQPWQRGWIADYNRIVGGIRIRQERSEEVTECHTHHKLLGFYGKPCVGGFAYESEPELPRARTMVEPQREFWLWATEDQQTLVDTLRRKEVEGWLDERTQKVEVAVAVFNGELGLHSVVLTNFYFSRSGHIWKKVVPMSTNVEWFRAWNYFLPALAFSGCLCFLFFVEVMSIWEMIQDMGIANFWRDYLEFYNANDWLSVIFGVVLAILFSFRIAASTTLNDSLEAIGQVADLTSEDYRIKAMDHMKLLEDDGREAYILRLMTAFYPLLLFLRIFKAFAAQPRLRFFTRAISRCWIDLLHFLIVFAAMFMIAAVAGVVLFGRETKSFTTLGNAMMSCLCFMLGEFEWEEIVRVGRVEASTWFMTFMLVSELIMLTVLLAMLLKAYRDATDGLHGGMTIWTQVGHLIERWADETAGASVSLFTVVNAVRTNQDYLEWRQRVDDEAKEAAMDMELEMRADGQESQLVGELGGDGDGTGTESKAMVGTASMASSDMGRFPSGKRAAVKARTSLASAASGDNEDEADAQEQVFMCVTIDFLMTYAGMSYEKAEDLLVFSVELFYSKLEDATGMEDVMNVVRRMNTTTKHMKATFSKSLAGLLGDNSDSEDEKTKKLNASEEFRPEKNYPEFIQEMKLARKELAQAKEKTKEIFYVQKEDVKSRIFYQVFSKGTLPGEVASPVLDEEDQRRELRAAQQTLFEARGTITDLEQRLMREREEKAQLENDMDSMNGQLEELRKVRDNVREEAFKMKGLRVENDYYRKVSELVRTNRLLRYQVLAGQAMGKASAPSMPTERGVPAEHDPLSAAMFQPLPF